jgi:hypothetical protein
MLPEAKPENLLYVADYGVGVIVYSYRPSRIEYVGLLSTPQQAEGECVDKAQNIFVTAGPYGIFEYAHGGTTPIAILGTPDIEPLNCSIDPTTGNLAAAGYPYLGGSYGAEVYKNARGRPTFYADSGFGDYECGYDDKGNLFIGGYVVSGHLNFAELPKGGSTFTNIALNQSFNAAGGIEVGSTPLNASGAVWQFFVDGNRVIVPSTFEDSSGTVNVYAYPAGGAAKKTRINAYDPDGVAVSLAKPSGR